MKRFFSIITMVGICNGQLHPQPSPTKYGGEGNTKCLRRLTNKVRNPDKYYPCATLKDLSLLINHIVYVYKYGSSTTKDLCDKYVVLLDKRLKELTLSTKDSKKSFMRNQNENRSDFAQDVFELFEQQRKNDKILTHIYMKLFVYTLNACIPECFFGCKFDPMRKLEELRRARLDEDQLEEFEIVWQQITRRFFPESLRLYLPMKTPVPSLDSEFKKTLKPQQVNHNLKTAQQKIEVIPTILENSSPPLTAPDEDDHAGASRGGANKTVLTLGILLAVCGGVAAEHYRRSRKKKGDTQTEQELSKEIIQQLEVELTQAL